MQILADENIILRVTEVNGPRELDMFRSLPKGAVVAWVLRRLGPPPSPPRRHFTKEFQRRASHASADDPGRAMRRRGSEGARHPEEAEQGAE
jgi:hypothetical protein